MIAIDSDLPLQKTILGTEDVNCQENILTFLTDLQNSVGINFEGTTMVSGPTALIPNFGF